ncbi:hypothetical protein A0128_03075 [Leptospira tipperaryensis]|uniref:Uncharacterized protein n=1 Tax=Leptospira tipperaryensis TaxID=2564040 RepID=A0A1D7UTJ3_9LEPT|nr:hypothetical protein A0128_03075 [Leptospira tipperaryensis]
MAGKTRGDFSLSQNSTLSKWNFPIQFCRNSDGSSVKVARPALNLGGGVRWREKLAATFLYHKIQL